MTAEEVQALRDTGIYGDLFGFFDTLLEARADELEDAQREGRKLEKELETVGQELTGAQRRAASLGADITHALSNVSWELSDMRTENGERARELVEEDLNEAFEGAEKLLFW